MPERIRVAIAGAAGRMGRASIRAVAAQPDMVLVAAVGRQISVGADAGTIAGIRALGVTIASELGTALTADVLVDFSPGPAAAQHAGVAIPAGVSPVIGGTGLSASELTALAGLCEARGVGAVVAPNFAVGAVLMMEFARQAAPHFPRVEIIELHHDRKRDAPSGTAVRTAALIAAARGGVPPASVKEEEMIAGARGGRADGIPVHSVRLPGLVAHQEVIFGGTGQTLTIRHDSISEDSFMPGLLLAIRRVRALPGLVYGLEKLLLT